MNNKTVISVDIYAKIYTDTFPQDMIAQETTGDQLFNFLISDCGHAFDEAGNLIPGDLVIWYLGCNEKMGNMSALGPGFSYNYEWSHGDSSFDIVQKFVTNLHKEGVFTEEQFKTLLEKIEEGRKVDCMYDIGEYLSCKAEGLPWTKKSEGFRDDMKKMIGGVKSFIQDQYPGSEPLIIHETKEEENPSSSSKN